MNAKTIESTAARWAEIQDQIKALKEEEDQIKTSLAALAPGTYEAGAHRIQVQAPRRTLNKKWLTAAYPLETHPEYYTPQIDTAKVKRKLASDDLEPYMEAATTPVIVLK